MSDWRSMVQKPWVIATGLVTATAVAALSLGRNAWLILLLVLVGIALGFAVVWFIRRWREGRQAAQFRAGLNQNASKAPGSIQDPNRRVELDRLRQKFNDGFQRVIEEGRRKGVDFLYRHPWIMVVGEPGSGKTEAIRHSGIVSPRMQDELQGVGGTLNMDWWFTERAVILDTAGRMVFEEEAGTANNEFQEFLRLLRKGRKLTPINGLLVTVSADTLVGGTDDQIRERSTKLGEKIAQIQSVLEVRFPVYVVVTKCDKITGFREFFESVDEPAMLNQILGWSNPEGLDVPFKAEQVEEHLNGVIQTLRSVRLRLLDRPAGPSGVGRRTDEVDSLYAFPHGLEMLAPRLKMYLEPVFASGEWSASAPLFVRGIYFSSALFQGAVLDQELAAALGVPVDKLGDEGKVFRRDRALFLRDLFVEKMLPERGLVTASHRTEGIVFRRRVVTWSTFAAVLLLGFGAFWWAYSNLNGDVAKEVELWRLAKANRSPAGFAPLIDRGERTGEWEYAGERLLTKDSTGAPMAADGNAMKRIAFHRDLETSTRKELSVPFVFRFGRDVNELRRKAQNTIFATDLVYPLVAAARDRISHDTKWQEQHTQVFSMLLQIETALQAGAAPIPSGELFLGPLVRFGVPSLQSATDAKALFALFDSSYYAPPGGKRQPWPPAFLAGGTSLAENAAMRSGIANLKLYRQEKRDEVAKKIRALGDLRDSLLELRKFEEKLATRRPRDSWKEEIRLYSALRDKIDQRVDACVKEGVFSASAAQMDPSIGRVSTELQSGKDELIKTIMARPFAPVSLDADTLAKFALLKEIPIELGKLSEGDSERVLAAFPDAKRAELRELDQQYLITDAAGVKRYQARVDLLKSLVAPAATADGSGEGRIIGNLAKMDRMIAERAGEEKAAAPATGTVRPAPANSDPVPRAARELLIELYEGEFNKFIDDYARFPLVSDRADKPIDVKDLPIIRRLLANIKDDADCLNTMGPSGRAADLRKRVVRCLGLFDRVVPALINAEDEIAQVKIQYPGKDEQLQAIRPIPGNPTRHVWFKWRVIKSKDRPWSAEADKEEEIGDFQVASDYLQLAFYSPSSSAPGGLLLDGALLAPLANWRLFQQMLDPLLPAPSRSDDGRKWRVVFSRQDEGPEKFYFALSVSFPQPLPLRANWPKWQQLKNP